MKHLLIALSLFLVAPSAVLADTVATPAQCLALRSEEAKMKAESIRQYIEKILLREYEGVASHISIKHQIVASSELSLPVFNNVINPRGGIFTPTLQNYKDAIALLNADGWRVEFESWPIGRTDYQGRHPQVTPENLAEFDNCALFITGDQKCN